MAFASPQVVCRSLTQKTSFCYTCLCCAHWFFLGHLKKVYYCLPKLALNKLTVKLLKKQDFCKQGSRLGILCSCISDPHPTLFFPLCLLICQSILRITDGIGEVLVIFIVLKTKNCSARSLPCCIGGIVICTLLYLMKGRGF